MAKCEGMKLVAKMEEEMKWIKHYGSDHKILLVGEGDFSFSACLAKFFKSATNMVATSLDTRDVVTAKYKHGKENLEVLKELGCRILHEVDVHTMAQHPYLNTTKYDRIVYNFPHAGFRYNSESNKSQIKLHRELVRGFFKSARDMLAENGEVHVTHKTAHPFSLWKVVELGMEVGLQLVEESCFCKLDYPGYSNKKGDGPYSNKSFPVGKCSTFKFALKHLQHFRAVAAAYDHKNKRKCVDCCPDETISINHTVMSTKRWKTSFRFAALPAPSYYSESSSSILEEDDFQINDGGGDEIIRWE